MQSINHPLHNYLTFGQQQEMLQHIQFSIHPYIDYLLSLAAKGSSTPLSLNELATQLTNCIRTSAFKKLPLTHAAAYKSKTMLQLQRQRRNITRLKQMATTLISTGGQPITSLDFMHLYNYCKNHHQLQWNSEQRCMCISSTTYDWRSWLEETTSHLRHSKANPCLITLARLSLVLLHPFIVC